ncbi:MAG: polysaccharide deacetylase family protein [Candidatus Improbicoccus pseudotrichonymphae]|uniref:Polysaccharide deacetylase family protein n=1 Tax=Candidatus Improbicoccus pseudotrichonymphae TaxID=3033792 RepID=A0AA48KVC0_9FIRM|nr:MAG: polysaccharide deacetylase family protein [Candidatus Improbicoccus pseudotrichonymphae]
MNKIYLRNQTLKIFILVLMTIIFFAVWVCLFSNFKTKTKIDANKHSGLVLPILMYHGITKNKEHENRFFINFKLFEKDLEFLKKHGFNTIFVSDLINFMNGNQSLPEKPIILTFDDGYLNNYLYVFPLIKKYNFKIILSPIGKCLDKYSTVHDRNPDTACVTWEDIKEMADSGLVEIQNHTYDMHSKKKRYGCKILKDEHIIEYEEKLAKDLTKFQESMEIHGIAPPNTFTYPFGAICEECEEIIKKLGFKASFSCYGKMNFIKSPSDSYSLGRFLRPNNISPENFFRKNKIN